MNRISTLVALIFCCPLLVFAQNGYKIDFEVKGLKDTVTYLGYYHGESTYIKDTTTVNAAGKFSFDGQSALDQGVYFLVLNRTRLFEFTVGEDQEFSIKTDTTDYIGKMEVKGDEGNTAFLENMLFNIKKNQEASPYLKVLKDSTKTEKEKAPAREAFAKIDKEVAAYQQSLIDSNPSSVLAKILKAKQPIDVPDAPVSATGVKDSTFGFRYYKAHYWDHFDLGDPVMLKMPTPVYRNKVNDYFEKLVSPSADSIIAEIDRLVEVAKKSEDTYRYFVWSVALKYQAPKIMGQDKVFVHIYDQFFATGDMDFWANGALKKNIKERADQLRLSLLGNKAPNLIMQDAQLKPQSLYDIKSKYTVIYFFDPDCGFCKKETPKLKSFYDDTKFDVEVFAVSADTSLAKMRNYIDEQKLEWVSVNGPRTYTENYHKLYDAQTTPTIYVLDKDKTIIAKKIGAGKIEEFLYNYEKSLQAP